MAENNQTANPFLSESETKNVSSPFASPKTSSTPARGESAAHLPKKTEPVQGEKAVSTTSKSFIEMPGPKFGGDTKNNPLPVSRKKRIHFWIGGLIVLLVAAGAYWWWQRTAEETLIETPSEVETPAAVAPVVTEEVPIILPDDLASYRSENFKAGEIVLLGEAEFLLGDDGIEPLTFEGIRGEAFTEKNKQEVKLVISWKTNKLSSAEIAYAKGIGQTPKTITEEDYSYNHSVILTGLDPASTYLYTVKAADRFGNVVTSEPYAVFTGARSVSLFDLIAGAIGDVFGWAVK